MFNIVVLLRIKITIQKNKDIYSCLFLFIDIVFLNYTTNNRGPTTNNQQPFLLLISNKLATCEISENLADSNS